MNIVRVSSSSVNRQMYRNSVCSAIWLMEVIQIGIGSTCVLEGSSIWWHVVVRIMVSTQCPLVDADYKVIGNQPIFCLKYAWGVRSFKVCLTGRFMSYWTIGHTRRFVSYRTIGPTGWFMSYRTIGPTGWFVSYKTIGLSGRFASYKTIGPMGRFVSKSKCVGI